MGYNPLPEGENIKFLNMPVEVNQRLQEIWNAIVAGSGSGIRNFFLIPYFLYKGEYAGNIHFQVVISKNADFSNPEYELDTATGQENWYCFSGEEWIAFPSGGMPTTFLQAAVTGLSFSDNSIRFVKWRAYHDNVYGDWVGAIL